MMEKQIERFLIVVLALTIISIIGSLFSSVFIARLYGPEHVRIISTQRKLVAIIPQVFGVLVHLGVAVWLFGLARRDASRPWMWSVFGAAFGLTAVILFYLIRMHDMLRTRIEAEEKT